MTVWSSDGRTLVIKGSMTDGAKLMIIDADTGTGQIVDLGIPIGVARYSPDDSLITFASGDEFERGCLRRSTGRQRSSADLRGLGLGSARRCGVRELFPRRIVGRLLWQIANGDGP